MLRGKGMLTPIQRSFIAEFALLPDQAQFYLAGGTALAEYYLGHRLSFDLDFFTGEASLVLPYSYQIEALGRQGGLEISVGAVGSTTDTGNPEGPWVRPLLVCCGLQSSG